MEHANYAANIILLSKAKKTFYVIAESKQLFLTSLSSSDSQNMLLNNTVYLNQNMLLIHSLLNTQKLLLTNFKALTGSEKSIFEKS
jgi:hypothetical protein